MSDINSKVPKHSKVSKVSKPSSVSTASSTVTKDSNLEKTALVPSDFQLESDNQEEIQLSSNTSNIKLDLENVDLYELGLLLGGFLSSINSFSFGQYYNDCCNAYSHHYGNCCNNMPNLCCDYSSYPSPSSVDNLGEIEVR